MVGFFEYLFYRVCWWDKHVVKNNINYPVFSASIVVTFFQGFNIIVIKDFILNYILKRRDLVVHDGNFDMILATIILALNWLYFRKKSSSLHKKIKNLSPRKKWILDVLIILYMVLTLVSAIILSGRIRNNI